MGLSKEGFEKLKQERIGQKRINNQGLEMECIDYNGVENITVKFYNPEYIAEKRLWKDFNKGTIKNLNYHNVFGIGMTGNKYPTRENGTHTKEYISWMGMLRRCCNEEYKEKNVTYTNVKCCEDWLYFPNFYEWLHNQDNFDKWYNGSKWAIDKDIICKGNKTYSPDTCCLVPQNINSLFTKRDKERGDYPIGVCYHKRVKMFNSYCHENGKMYSIGYFNTIEDAFNAYKKYKENLIKRIAKDEFERGNITEKCYNAMINYEVEITD